jgi:hypothetical protein
MAPELLFSVHNFGDSELYYVRVSEINGEINSKTKHSTLALGLLKYKF